MIRTPSTSDIPSVRALVSAQVRDARIAAPLLELAERAIAQPDDERACLIASAGSEVEGVAVYGMVAGADGAGRLHLLAGDQTNAAALVDAVHETLGGRRARIMVAELADVPGLAALIALLHTHGLNHAGRVSDYFAPSVDLILMQGVVRPR